MERGVIGVTAPLGKQKQTASYEMGCTPYLRVDGGLRSPPPNPPAPPTSPGG